jgi:RNA polymerase sigma factor (sigma-70 family)
MQAYARPLFRYGIRLVKDSDLVKDCIQDIFFELWNRREKISQAVSIKSYLFKALRLRLFREQAKWNQSVMLTDDYPFSVEFSLEDKLIEQQTSEEIRLKLEKALNSLPKRQKEILYLRFYENLDHDQIAQVMELNRQSVYNLLHEAVNRLRAYWLKEWIVLFLLICA